MILTARHHRALRIGCFGLGLMFGIAIGGFL